MDVGSRTSASTRWANGYDVRRPVRQKTGSCPKPLAHGEDNILHAVLDVIVDDCRPVMETVIETVMAEVEAIEDRILKRQLLPTEVERLYPLRCDLPCLRTAAVFPSSRSAASGITPTWWPCFTSERPLLWSGSRKPDRRQSTPYGHARERPTTTMRVSIDTRPRASPGRCDSIPRVTSRTSTPERAAMRSVVVRFRAKGRARHGRPP